MTTQYKYISYPSIKEMVTNTSKSIADILSEAIASRGYASIMLSGGSSPRPVYEALSSFDLPWSKVFVGLVDDRWIEAGLARV